MNARDATGYEAERIDGSGVFILARSGGAPSGFLVRDIAGVMRCYGDPPPCMEVRAGIRRDIDL